MPYEYTPEELRSGIEELLAKYRETQSNINRKVRWHDEIQKKRSKSVRKAAIASVKFLESSGEQYSIHIQLDGTLPDGRNYELDIQIMDYIMQTGSIQNGIHTNCAFYSAKNAKFMFEADGLENIGNLVSVSTDKSDKQIHFLSEINSAESKRIFEYVTQTYKSIIDDIREKVHGLLDMVYESTILPRAKGSEEFF